MSVLNCDNSKGCQMKKGCRIVIYGKICRLVEIVHSSWNGTVVIYSDSHGSIGEARLDEIRVPKKSR